jgi:TetR/AcrR family transcriptional regulator, regulator of autoinduction and epiphytic fitness
MREPVKPHRRYDSSRRRAQAAQTRLDIVTAARGVFEEQGYTRAAIAKIAQAAGVVVETIYRTFGGKAALFKAVIEAAIAGGTARAAVPVEERTAVRAIIAETDARRQLELYADTQPGIHARVGPLLRVLQEGAASDPELAELWKKLEAERLHGMSHLPRQLAQRQALRPGLSVEEARDILWTLNSQAVYDLLVEERGWSAERYRDWIAFTLKRLLLPDEPRPSPSRQSRRPLTKSR